MKKYLIGVIGVLLFAGSVGLVTKYVILDKNDNKTEQPDKGKDNTTDNDIKPDDEDKKIVISDVVVDFEKCEDKIFENKNLELSRFIENIGKNKSENSIQKCSVLKNEKNELLLYKYSNICYEDDIMYAYDYVTTNIKKLDLPKYSEIKDSFSYDFRSDYLGTNRAVFVDKNDNVYLYIYYQDTVTKIDTKGKKIKYVSGITHTYSYYLLYMVTEDNKALTLDLTDITDYESYKLVKAFLNDNDVFYRVYINDKGNVMTFGDGHIYKSTLVPFEFRDDNGKLFVVDKLILRNNETVMFISNNKVYIHEVSSDKIKLYNNKTVKDTSVEYNDNEGKATIQNEQYFCSLKTTSKFIINYTDGTKEVFTN